MAITVMINNGSVEIDELWYHYKKNPTDYLTFTFFIGYTEEKLIQIVENYVGKSIFDTDIQKIVLAKDEKNQSLGLLWYISNYFESKSNEKHNYDWKYVLNNIKEVFLIHNGLIIKGEATPYISR